MKNFKIAIYGNIIVDHVYCVDSFNGLVQGGSNKSVMTFRGLGASGNVVRAIRALDEDIDISVVGMIGDDELGDYSIGKFEELGVNVENIIRTKNHRTSSAVIIPDFLKQERTSIVDWGACTHMTDFADVEADWNHLMYIDTLMELEEKDFKSFKGIVSADLCLGDINSDNRQRILRLLPHIDYVIMSEQEATKLVQENHKGVWRTFNERESARIIGEMSRGWSVVHHPEGSYVSDGNVVMEYRTKLIKNTKLNVLGAGDYFAGNFIHYILTNDTFKMDKCIEYAHNNVKKYLLDESS